MRRRYVNVTLVLDIPDGVSDAKLERALAFVDESVLDEEVEIGGKRRPMRVVPRDFILNSVTDFPASGKRVQRMTTGPDDMCPLQ